MHVSWVPLVCASSTPPDCHDAGTALRSEACLDPCDRDQKPAVVSTLSTRWLSAMVRITSWKHMHATSRGCSPECVSSHLPDHNIQNQEASSHIRFDRRADLKNRSSELAVPHGLTRGKPLYRFSHTHHSFFSTITQIGQRQSQHSLKITQRHKALTHYSHAATGHPPWIASRWTKRRGPSTVRRR